MAAAGINPKDTTLGNADQSANFEESNMMHGVNGGWVQLVPLVPCISGGRRGVWSGAMNGISGGGLGTAGAGDGLKGAAVC